MQFFIYMTTNLIDGKRYIGQHYGREDDSYLGSGVRLVNAVKKYGKNNFKREILCFCENQEDANQKEKYYIALYDAVNRDDFYNILPGGCGYHPPSEEALEKRKKELSQSMKGENNPFYGHTWGGKENHPRYGMHHTEESKQKMREKKLGKKLPEEQKKKIRENNPNVVSVDMYDLDGKYIRTFFCIRDVVRFLGMKGNTTQRLRDHLDNGKPYHGYIFKRHKQSEEPVTTSCGSAA